MELTKFLTVITVISFVSPLAVALQDTFEDGDVSEWEARTLGSSSFSASSSNSYGGAYAGFMDQGGSSTNPQWYRNHSSSKPSNLTVAIRVTAYGSFSDVFIDWNNKSQSTGIYVNFDYTTSDGINVNGNVITSSFNLDQWYLVEMRDIDWQNGVIGSVYLDGSEQLTSVSFQNDISSTSEVEARIADDGGTDFYVDNLTLYSTDSPNITSSSPDSVNRNASAGVELELDVKEPQDEAMNISFYNGSDNTLIAEFQNVGNGTYSTTWTGLSDDSSYEWYANVTDGSSTSWTGINNFTTEKLSLTWNDNSENEDGFRIYSNASGSMESLGSVGANLQSYADASESLSPGRYVCYELTSFNSYGESDPASDCLFI